jgi:hypothetical protein
MDDRERANLQLDRLAEALPGWIGRKVFHGLGWTLIGAAYVVAAAVTVGGFITLATWLPETGVGEWVTKQNGLIVFVVGLGAAFGLLYCCFGAGLSASASRESAHTSSIQTQPAVSAPWRALHQ